MSDNNQAIEWYLARDGQQHGPISELELRKVIELGYLRPTDLVWRQGMADWAPAATMLQLPPAPAPAAPAPAPQPAAQAPRAEPRPAEARAEPRQIETPAPAPHVRLEPEPRAPAPAPRPAEKPQRGPEPQAARQAQPAPQPVARSHGPGAMRDSAGDAHTVPHPQPAGPAAPAPQPVGPARGHPQPHAQGFPQPQPAHQPHPGMQAHGPQHYQPHPAAQWDARMQRPDAPGPAPQPGHPMPAHPGALHPQPLRPGQPLAPRQVSPRLGEADEADEPEDEPRRGFPWRTAAVLVVLAGLGGGTFALWKSGQLSALPYLGAPSAPGTVPVVSAPGGSSREPAGGAPLTGAAGSIDQSLQRSPLWQRLKRDFPDWYAEQLGEASRLAGDSRDEREIQSAMTRAVVDLRRKHATEALAASPARLKTIASSFVENLSRLARQSTASCYGFISQGEMSPALSELRTPEQRAGLDAQLASIFDAVVEGRKAPQRYEAPRREDYDMLTGELAKRGWTPADLQLFSDARALARAAPEKVCQMVQDWFAAQLAVKDDAARLRLLAEALKPVVAG